MPDVKKLAGGAPVASEILVNVDHITIEGDGSETFPLRAIGTGNSGVTGFEYTVQIGDTDTITVPLPGVGRPDANYVASAFGLDTTDFLEFQCPPSGYTTTTLVLKCNAQPTVGDVIGFILVEKS